MYRTFIKKYGKMKLITLSLFMLIVQIQQSPSQTTWAPAGAEWHYDYFSFTSIGYTKIKYVNDTVIEGKSCKTLQKTIFKYSYLNEEYDTIFSGNEYTYLESNIVYYYRFGNFYKLYDFNSTSQDSWQIAGTEPTSSYSCDSLSTVIVDSSDIFTYNGYDLRRLYITYDETKKWLIYGQIVERLGALSYMFPLNNCVLDAENEGSNLRCYYDDEFGFYSVDNKACDFILNVEYALVEIEPIKIYPNIITSYSVVKVKSNEEVNDIKIYDLQGTLVYNDIKRGTNFSLNLSFIEDGYYIVRINNSVHKLLINRN